MNTTFTVDDIQTLKTWGFWLYPMTLIRTERKKVAKFPIINSEKKVVGETSEWKGVRDGKDIGWYGTKTELPNEVILEFLKDGYELCAVITNNLAVIDCDDKNAYHSWLSILTNIGISPIIKEKSLSNTEENQKHHLFFSVPDSIELPYCTAFSKLKVFQTLQGLGELLSNNHLLYLNKNGWETPPSEYYSLPLLPENCFEKIEEVIGDQNFQSNKVVDVDFGKFINVLKKHGLSRRQVSTLLTTYRDVVCTSEHYIDDNKLKQIIDCFPNKSFPTKDKKSASGNRHAEFISFLGLLNVLGLSATQMRGIGKPYCEIAQLEPFDGERFNTDFNGYGYPIKNPIGLVLNKTADEILDDISKYNEPEILDYVAMLAEMEFEYINGDFYRYLPNRGIWKRELDDTVLKIVSDLVNQNAIKPHPKLAENVIKHARGTLGNTYERKMNQDKDSIVLINGVFNTKTLSLLPFLKTYYSTSQIPVTYNPVATCPRWEKFLSEVLPEQELRLLLQEWSGYCLTADTSHHRSLFLFGFGRNGKSIFGNMLTKLVGSQNTSFLEFSEIGEKHSTGMLEGKLLNWGEEIREGTIKDTAQFKKIVAGGVTKIEDKYKPAREMLPTVKLMFSGNVLPKSRDKSDGFIDRLIIVPFKQKFSDEIGNINRNLENELSEELDGIFNWAIEGLKRLRLQGKFTESITVKTMVREYEVEHNSVMLFIEENYTVTTTGRVNSVDAYRHYREWCLSNGYTPFNSRNFYSTLEIEYGVERVKSGNIRYLNLKPVLETFGAGF